MSVILNEIHMKRKMVTAGLFAMRQSVVDSKDLSKNMMTLWKQLDILYETSITHRTDQTRLLILREYLTMIDTYWQDTDEIDEDDKLYTELIATLHYLTLVVRVTNEICEKIDSIGI